MIVNETSPKALWNFARRHHGESEMRSEKWGSSSHIGGTEGPTNARCYLRTLLLLRRQGF